MVLVSGGFHVTVKSSLCEAGWTRTVFYHLATHGILFSRENLEAFFRIVSCIWFHRPAVVL